MLGSLSDSSNLLSKLTPKRAVNSAKVLSSYYRSKAAKKSFHRGMPISISFEPTTSCNLRCPECPSGLRSFSRPTGMLTTDTYQKIIDEVHETLMYLILYFQGEPYLNPSFFDFVSYAKTKNIYSATSTNAHYLDQENARKTVESGLDRMIISLDGTDQETYEKYRVGGDFNKVIEGTKELVSQKRRLKSFTPYIILQFIVFNHNEQQISEVKKLGASIGVDSVAIKTAQIYDYENGSDLIPSQGDYARYQQNGDSRWHIKNELLNHCWKMWHSSVITWDGKVVPCCFDKDAKHVLGDASNHGFKEIWNGESYNNFRNQLMISRDEIDICKNCTEGTKVWA